MITLEDYFGKMSHMEPPSEEVVHNAKVLLGRVNALLAQIAEFNSTLEAAVSPIVTSGWRPESYNKTVKGSAKKSLHITGHAIDLADEDGELDDFLFNNVHMLVDAGLWLEHPASTRRWCHMQSQPPRSGNRFFFP